MRIRVLRPGKPLLFWLLSLAELALTCASRLQRCDEKEAGTRFSAASAGKGPACPARP